MAIRKPKTKSSEHILDIDGLSVPLVVRRHPTARRLTLRLDKDGSGAVVTIPKYSPFKEGVDMARRKADWIKRQLGKQPVQVPFVDGGEIAYLGQPHILRHVPGGRGVSCEDGEIRVTGRAEHFQRRARDWLKAQAKTEVTTRAHKKAALINQRLGRITVRDTRSRWGSCGSGGTLNFSWRLIFAPEFVLDYVVAHEVAHLVHRDHSKNFWALSESLCDNQSQARDWLNAFGRDLYKYGD